jgi:serine/threonine protein kinase
MAEVHLGRDARLGRGVAIKLLRTDLARDPVFQARFKREAQSAAGLNHPAIVQLVAAEALERRGLETRLSIATQMTPSEVFQF